MGVKKDLKTFKRVRNLYSNDEKKALADVVKDSGEAETNLRAHHTKKTFQWTMIR